MIPTKRIDEADFKKLEAQVGEDLISVFKLVLLEFLPPLPKDEKQPDYRQQRAIKIIFLNVLEPSIYVDPQKDPFVIMPLAQELDFGQCADIFTGVKREAWAYRLAPLYWQEKDFDADFDYADYIFPDTELAPFKKGDVTTH